MVKFHWTYLFAFTQLFLLSRFCSFGQSEEQVKDIKKAEQNYNNGNYGDALRIYLPLLETLDEEAIIQHNLNYKIGFCYYASAPEDSFAVSYFRKYLERSDVHFEAYYFLGNIAASKHNFDSAIFYFNKFKEYVENNTELSNSGLSEQIIEIADKQTEKCEFGKFLIKFPGCASVESIPGGVNTEYSEYAPVINSDETNFAFTKRSPETLGGRISDDGDFFEDIFLSKLNRLVLPLETDSFGNPVGDATYETLSFSAPVNLGQRVNTEGHEGAIQFSADGKKIYIYRKSYIWVSEMKKKQTPYPTKNWKKAKKQKQIKGVLLPKTFEPSVSISQEGSIIYFSSERQGGMGGLDLYRSVRGTDGKWSVPSNLGESINTPYDEDAPFISGDGKTLYFSSKGHSNMGDYDIFVSEFLGDPSSQQEAPSSEWTKPLNMGFPVNSANDDIFFTLSPLSGRGYFSSNRANGNGLMDIYEASFPANPVSKARISGVVLSNDSTPAYVNISFIDSEKPDDSTVIFTDSITGEYSFPLKFGKTYFLNINEKNFEPFSDTTTVPGLVYFCQQYNETLNFSLQKIMPDTLPATDSLSLPVSDSLARPVADSLAITDSVAAAALARTLGKILKSEKKPPTGIAEPTTEIIFRVQIGAFKNPLSKNIYQEISDLRVISFEDGYTRYFSGAFSNIKEVRARKEEIIAAGFPDAFIVAFRGGEKIPISDALKKR